MIFPGGREETKGRTRWIKWEGKEGRRGTTLQHEKMKTSVKGAREYTWENVTS